jgi:simple sugar transport system permease protein
MKNKFMEHFKYPLLSILIGFLVGSVFIVLTKNNPFSAYYAMFDGNFGSFSKFGELLLKTTPLILTGLSVAFAFRAGLFNIGAEGQYIIGAIFTIGAGYIFRDLPSPLLIPILLIAGTLGGALFAAIPGILKAKFGVHEVIVTIMLNYIGLDISNFLVRTILNPSTLQGDVQKAHSYILPESAHLTKLSEILPIFGSSSAHVGIFVSVIVAVLAYYLLFKTTMGYEIRSVGHNMYAAEYAGISPSKNIVLAMLLSGAFAGLAGALVVTGLSYKVDMGSASAGYGIIGISVALVGQSHPLGVIASSFLFGILSNGARKMQIAGVPKEIVGIIQGVIIIFIAGEAIFKEINKRKIAKLEKQKTKEVA